MWICVDSIATHSYPIQFVRWPHIKQRLYGITKLINENYRWQIRGVLKLEKQQRSDELGGPIEVSSETSRIFMVLSYSGI